MEPRISESNFGRISKMAAKTCIIEIRSRYDGGRHFESMGAAILNRDVTSVCACALV